MRILVTGGSGFIGTNLMEELIRCGKHVLLNFDGAAPKVLGHMPYWHSGDLLNKAEVLETVQSFKPEVLIHMAARTDTDPVCTLDDYKVNTEGSKNILEAIRACESIKRAIITSTQFVNQYHGIPKHDEDFAPHTKYGESKVIMEQMTRKARLSCAWTIIRPTNIWGPWHIRYPSEFWRVLSKGLYFHPGKKPVIRSYGYVGNVVAQVVSIMESPIDKIDQQVFYVGDMPIDIYHWVNGFSLKQIGKKVRVMPRFFVKLLALVGDALSLIHIRFPLTSSRYKSMTNSNTAPMEKTISAFGNPPYTLDQGIDETVNWLKTHHPDLVKVK
jgi:nucleoside-diphosphate-sugar epimerase